MKSELGMAAAKMAASLLIQKISRINNFLVAFCVLTVKVFTARYFIIWPWFWQMTPWPDRRCWGSGMIKFDVTPLHATVHCTVARRDPFYWPPSITQPREAQSDTEALSHPGVRRTRLHREAFIWSHSVTYRWDWNICVWWQYKWEQQQHRTRFA